MIDKLQIIQQRYDEVSDLIIQPDIISDQKRYVLLSKEYKDLIKIVAKSEINQISINSQRSRRQ